MSNHDTIISKFTDAMTKEGLAPSGNTRIIPDNKNHHYQLSRDKKSKKNGSYILNIDGDFGYGSFKDWGTDERFSWSSKSNKELTKEQKKAFMIDTERKREEAQKEQMAVHSWKALEAKEFISQLPLCPDDHPYLVKKQITAHNALLYNNDIILPLKDHAGKIWSYQSIGMEGEKLFLPEAKKQECWYEIEGDDTILMTEGFATGASLHQASGHTVIITMDADNLVQASLHIRKKYKNNKIVICADNDHERKDGNKGLQCGKKAQKLLSCDIIKPVKKAGDTDFNDYHVACGIDKLKEVIAGVVQKDLSFVYQATPCNDDWKSQLAKDKKDNVIPKSMYNLKLIMENYNVLDGLYKYDSFSKRYIVNKCPPWENDNVFEVRPISDQDYFNLEVFLEHNCGLQTGKNRCADAINAVAALQKNTFNPAADYFKSLKWDGTERLKGWMKKYVTDGKQDAEYLSTVGIKFMCGLAARAMHAGVKFDTMLILEGKQNAGKSTLCEIMATINGVPYFLDDFKDIESKDALMKIQGKLVVEFPEINAMRKAEINDMKAFLSRTHDVFRPPYGRNTIECGRQCVFIGTINPEGGYLRDVTGNRRYLPISCRDHMDLAALRDVMPQLHAEAAHLVLNGEQLWLNANEFGLAEKERSERVLEDIWTDRVSQIVSNRDFMPTDDLLTELNIVMDKRNPIVQSRVTQIMVTLGYKPTRKQMDGARKRGFIKTALQPALLDNEEEVPW